MALETEAFGASAPCQAIRRAGAGSIAPTAAAAPTATATIAVAASAAIRVRRAAAVAIEVQVAASLYGVYLLCARLAGDGFLEHHLGDQSRRQQGARGQRRMGPAVMAVAFLRIEAGVFGPDAVPAVAMPCRAGAMSSSW